jgi:hypothetical protein
MGENRYHVKFSLNSTNNLNYKETSPEFIAVEKLKNELNLFLLLGDLNRKNKFIKPTACCRD